MGLKKPEPTVSGEGSPYQETGGGFPTSEFTSRVQYYFDFRLGDIVHDVKGHAWVFVGRTCHYSDPEPKVYHFVRTDETACINYHWWAFQKKSVAYSDTLLKHFPDAIRYQRPLDDEENRHAEVSVADRR